MRWGRISDHDNLFRHCVYPFSFKGKKFDPNSLIKIYDEPDGSLLASLVWERYVPTPEHLHRYGCRLALSMNNKERNAGRFKEKNRRIYCGAYQLEGKAVRALAATEKLDEVEYADVVHHIEEGEIAHTDLIIGLKAVVGDREGTKTAIAVGLWNACSGPIPHRCDGDQDIRTSEISILPTAPRGPYLDARSYLHRVYCTIRFVVCNWLWQNSLPGARTEADVPSRFGRLRSNIKFRTCNWIWGKISQSGA